MALDIKTRMAHIYAMNEGQSRISGTLPDSPKKQRLDAALTEVVEGLSRERVKSLIAGGNLVLDGAKGKEKRIAFFYSTDIRYVFCCLIISSATY